MPAYVFTVKQVLLTYTLMHTYNIDAHIQSADNMNIVRIGSSITCTRNKTVLIIITTTTITTTTSTTTTTTTIKLYLLLLLALNFTLR